MKSGAGLLHFLVRRWPLVIAVGLGSGACSELSINALLSR